MGKKLMLALILLIATVYTVPAIAQTREAIENKSVAQAEGKEKVKEKEKGKGKAKDKEDSPTSGHISVRNIVLIGLGVSALLFGGGLLVSRFF